MTEIFSVPISTGGSFVCSSPTSNLEGTENNKVYLLTFISPPDNRLTPAFIEAFILSLDIIEHRLPKGVVITTSGIAKFFSNGLDLAAVLATEGFPERYLWRLFRRLLTYPLPTIALVNGHAFAGGLMLAMYHDYRVQNPSKGFVCLNEIQLGVPLQPPMTSIFRDKVPSAVTLRSLILEGKRFPGSEALTVGLVDALGGLGEAIKFAHDRNLFELAKSPVYTPLKEGLYKQTLAVLDDEPGNQAWVDQKEKVKDAYFDEAVGRVRKWETKGGGTKL